MIQRLWEALNSILWIGICSWYSENAKSRIGMDLVVMQIEQYEGVRSIYNVMVTMQMKNVPLVSK